VRPWHALALLLVAGCGGPSLSQLVAGKHYREAVCLATDGSQSERDRLERALTADAQLYVHVHVITKEELRPLLAESTDLVSSRALFVRVRAQSNVLPVDRMKVSVALAGSGTRVPAKPLDGDSLAFATHEDVPKPHTESSVNPLGVLVTIVTFGIFGNLGGGRTETVQPTEREYRDAPIAFKLRKAMPDAHCEALDMGGRGQSCQAFFIVDPQVDVPVKLVVGTTYEADRSADDGGDACSIAAESSVSLGPPRDIANRTQNLFGRQARRVDTLSD
jgi:hypothetical protein